MEKQLSLFPGQEPDFPMMEEYRKQDERVLEIFKTKLRPLTPFDVYRFYVKEYCNCPVTSIRRAISNLTKDGILQKTEIKKTERWGKPNYYWKLNK